MRLVVNTNRIIAALIRDSTSRAILFSDKFEFVTVGLTKVELNRHKEAILRKAKISEADLEKLMSLIFSRVFVVSDVVIERTMEDAKRIMDGIDKDDTPFIALALAVDNEGIWSDDPHFQEQNAVRVWTTKDLVGYLSTNI